MCLYIYFYISLVQESCLVTETEEPVCIRPPAGLLGAVLPTFERELHKNGKLFVQHVQQNPAATAESLDRGRNGLVPGRGGKVLSAGTSGALLNSGNSSQTTWGSLVPLLLSPRGPHRNCFPVENNCFFLGRLTIFNTPGLGDRVRQHGLE